MSAVTNNLSINIGQPSAEVPDRWMESAVDREGLIPRPPEEAGNRTRWSTWLKARLVAGGVLATGALAATVATTESMAINFHLSRSTRFWCTLGQWSGFTAAFAVGIPTAIESRCHAASVIARRIIGTGISTVGAFAVDAAAQQNQGDYKGADYLGLGFFLAGMTVAFGPEVYREWRTPRN